MEGYQLKVFVKSIQPIWRVIKIPAKMTFMDLHIIIQEAFGLNNEDTFYFELQDLDISVIRLDDRITVNSKFKTILCNEIVYNYFYEGMNCDYFYGLENKWEFGIIVEELLNNYDVIPKVTDYFGNNLLEDCGGIIEYEKYINEIDDEQIRFDLNCVNECLEDIEVEQFINNNSIKKDFILVLNKLKNIIKKQTEGGIMNFPIRSCALDECIIRGKKLIGWDEKYPVRDIGNNKVRAVGMSVGTHGSGIANIDMAIVNMRMDEDGTYKLFSGSSDLGTGSDTILAQIAAKALNTSIDRISVYTGDTDMCPYDTGAYASCTTYVTGNATIKSAESLKQKILKVAQKKLDLPIDDLILYEDRVCYSEDVEKFVLLSELGKESVGGGNQEVLYSSESYGIQESAKPFLAGFAEIELDKTTGEFKVINYACSTDCGTVMNPALARIQVEGGVTQGIGLAMYEDPRHGSDGKLQTSNLLQYKVPTKKDIGNIIVDFVDNYEPTGPYGAKSLGEIVIHTPAPAIANAIYNATGVRIRELPITSEKVYMAMKKLNQGGK